ncbi:MBL fold metallo-hydrolase [Campylobacter sp. faydin G-105]|uniref:MBL fold metallo-hydrolase n=1 Tax=Campylobacter anatolicus TaxID=2829105 RepID=UPI001B9302A7|nr:MBL fold metallo-hydrolase [Campylobacter anatolicus]MBR8462035.1 MBL fold metallo-hydrolase [Campylobacter anatolicus]
MEILVKAFGEYDTNCYIVKFDDFSIVIDPGKGASKWVKLNASDAVAILCTHGHFDHIYDVATIKRELKIPVYIHKNDTFMALDDVFDYGYECFSPDVLVSDENFIHFNDIFIRFYHLPGHTPGCCMVQVSQGMNEKNGSENLYESFTLANNINECDTNSIGSDIKDDVSKNKVSKSVIFSGDFLFRGSIGRWDFPYSNKFDMIKSLQKCKGINGDFAVYPGHGDATTLKAEQANLDMWIEYIYRS